MKKFLIISAGILGITVASLNPALAAGDATAGKNKSATCAACHGADGNSANPIWPKLAGQGADYLAKQLRDFKAGNRKDPTMTGMAAPLSDQDIDDLAAYFSSQKLQPGTADAAQVAAGEKIFRGGNSASGVAACAGCHGPAGAGNPAAKFPAIAGQHDAYAAKQLNDFRSGTRANDAGKMMQNVAGKMTEAEIKAVTAYLVGLH